MGDSKRVESVYRRFILGDVDRHNDQRRNRPSTSSGQAEHAEKPSSLWVYSNCGFLRIAHQPNLSKLDVTKGVSISPEEFF
jgi:hypothetical protein